MEDPMDEGLRADHPRQPARAAGAADPGRAPPGTGVAPEAAWPAGRGGAGRPPRAWVRAVRAVARRAWREAQLAGLEWAPDGAALAQEVRSEAAGGPRVPSPALTAAAVARRRRVAPKRTPTGAPPARGGAQPPRPKARASSRWDSVREARSSVSVWNT